MRADGPLPRRVAFALAAMLGLLAGACQGGGMGMGMGYSYPGRFYGPVDSSRFGGGGPVVN